MKKNKLIWAVSLLIIAFATIILAVSNIGGMELPDTAVRIIGIIDLVFLPVFAYSTVKKLKKD